MNFFSISKFQKYLINEFFKTIGEKRSFSEKYLQILKTIIKSYKY